MAIPICPGITYTMGGLAIDERAQVIDTRGEVIPGLLAAGATTGGLEGGENAVYLGGLIKAGVFGLIAAEQAARLQGKVAPAAPRADAQATPEAVPQAPTQTALPSSAATAKSLPTGLARFPILSAMVRYGSRVAIGGGVVLGLLICLAGWPWIGALSVVIGAIVGGIVCVGLLALVELIKLITELLIPG
jgi:fumarate reductase flavoprotein subunit